MKKNKSHNWPALNSATIGLSIMLLAACSGLEAAPMYSPVNVSGNNIEADTGPISKDMNGEFCPPESVTRNNC